MEKILVSIFIPALGEAYNVLIPKFLTVKEVISLLVEAVSNLTQRRYSSSGKEILCRKNPEMILEYSYYFEDYEIKNGESLYLF